MTFIEITLIALSLALDVGVVSVGAGALHAITFRRAVVIAFVFGAFHAVMPLIGWTVGYWFREYLLEYGNVIGFALLLIVGLKMLKDALGTENTEREKNIQNAHVLFILALATSIDALVIGFTFNFLEVPVTLAIATIGFVTFFVSLLGTHIGRKSRHLIGTRIEMVGAMALILLAFKTLLF